MAEAVNVKDTGLRLSAWLLYVIIVFEIIFMISPAAFYYYSVYGLPLNALVENQYLSWLTQYILPHFSSHDSFLGNFLIAISWPLIFFGLVMFIWGFVQIYYAKFTGKGEVTTGLYQYIRHPQYTALAVVGLGTTLFWSRFVVLIAFVTMMYLYVLLARIEEHRCLNQFGDAYKDYLERTGRFLPLSVTSKLPAISLGGTGTFVAYALTLLLLLPGGWWFKLHVISQMNVIEDENLTVIAIAPMEAGRTDEVLRQARAELPSEDSLVYIVPGSWNIPELGISGKRGYDQTAGAELAHPTMHGNLPDYEGTAFYVLVTKPVYRSPSLAGLEHIVEMEPLFRIDLDIATGDSKVVKELSLGKWAGIPVPVY